MKRRASRSRLMPWYWPVAAFVVFVGIGGSGVWIASMAQDVRGLFVGLEQNQRRQDELLAEYSRLLIERGTLASYQNIDQLAERALAMHFPEAVERVAP